MVNPIKKIIQVELIKITEVLKLGDQIIPL